MARKHNNERVGDILGLGDTPAGHANGNGPGRRHESEAQHRHERMSEGADELTPEPRIPRHTPGATSVDMGAGGEGTDIA